MNLCSCFSGFLVIGYLNEDLEFLRSKYESISNWVVEKKVNYSVRAFIGLLWIFLYV